MTQFKKLLPQFGILPLLCALLLTAGNANAHGEKADGHEVPKGQAKEGGIRTGEDKILDQVGFEQKLQNQVPLDLEFRDESGKTVQLRQYFGTTPVIILPIYYRCGMLCPLGAEEMLRTLKQVKSTIGRDFQIVTVSIDPKETPAIAAETKKGYIKQYERDMASAEVGWHFLTGKHEAIDKLCDAIGFRYAYVEKTGEYAHPDGIVVVTPEGKVARYFYRLDYPPRDVQFGLMEAAKERIGSPLAYLALSCFHYDPTTGKYNLSIMKVLRLFSAVFVVLCLSVIFIAVGREKKASQRALESEETKSGNKSEKKKENHSEVLPVVK